MSDFMLTVNYVTTVIDLITKNMPPHLPNKYLIWMQIGVEDVIQMPKAEVEAMEEAVAEAVIKIMTQAHQEMLTLQEELNKGAEDTQLKSGSISLLLRNIKTIRDVKDMQGMYCCISATTKLWWYARTDY